MESFWKGQILGLRKHISRMEFCPIDEMTDEDLDRLDFESLTPAQQARIVRMCERGTLTGFWWLTYDNHVKPVDRPISPAEAALLVFTVGELYLYFLGQGPRPEATEDPPVESARVVKDVEGSDVRDQFDLPIGDHEPHGGKDNYLFPASSDADKDPEDFYDAQA